MTDRAISSVSDHLIPHVCFHCRKVFKHALQSSNEQTGGAALEVLSEAICPECGAVMHGAIRDFHAPRQNDDRKWRQAEENYRKYLCQVLPAKETDENPPEPFFVARKHRAQAEVTIK